MKNIYNDKICYADTDAYGVVWHGTYLRLMEKGRVLFCDELGLDLVELMANDIAIPVANINIRYKSPAVLNEYIKVETTVCKVTPLAVTFHQIISNTESGQIHTDAEVIVVCVNNSGKLYRRLPEELAKIFNEGIVCND